MQKNSCLYESKNIYTEKEKPIYKKNYIYIYISEKKHVYINTNIKGHAYDGARKVVVKIRIFAKLR